MSKILITYTTNSGSTAEVADRIGAELEKQGAAVDVRPMEAVTGLEGYSAAVLGAPMIMGWHRTALRFLKKHQDELQKIPVACFLTAMSLTETRTTLVDGIPVFVDPGLAQAPKQQGRLTFKEGYATAENYVRPVLKAAPRVKPVSVALFGGKLELFRLKLLQMLFVMVVIQAQPGDRRNWQAVSEWAAGLSAHFMKDVLE